ncbi:MAG: DegT/DnrJ/EryC1/StrS family aminotransferase, partial [Bacteroidota bacterium]|nr:DegT/DnrJ/EryC1/StrS family aminotransferase [Bacteroidota bacterium]
LNIDSSCIEEKITERTRAILVVHLYGRCGMNAEIQRIAARYNLKIVEDNAQAAGCVWSGRRTGSLGDAAAHSFFPTKNLGALGDGGAVTTNDAALEQMIRTLGNYGSHAKGLNDVRGVNSRLDEIQAAALSVKLPRLESDNDRRREIAGYYLANIKNTAITLPTEPASNERDSHVWHLFVVRCKHRDKFQQYLREQGIETLVHYPVPPHQQGAFRQWNSRTLPITEAIHREVCSLPLHPLLEDREVKVIADAANRFTV